MCRLGGVHDFPAVFLENHPLLFGQAAVRVVDNQTRAQRHKGGVDVNRVGVTGEVHRMDAHVRVFAFKPFHGFAVGGEAVLDKQVFAHPHHVGGIKQNFFFGGDKVFIGGAHQALFQRNAFIVVIVFVGFVAQARSGRLRP